MTYTGQPDCPSAYLCGFISLTASAAQPGTVYALGPNILKSIDRGATWIRLPLPETLPSLPITWRSSPASLTISSSRSSPPALYDFRVPGASNAHVG